MPKSTRTCQKLCRRKPAQPHVLSVYDWSGKVKAADKTKTIFNCCNKFFKLINVCNAHVFAKLIQLFWLKLKEALLKEIYRTFIYYSIFFFHFMRKFSIMKMEKMQFNILCNNYNFKFSQLYLYIIKQTSKQTPYITTSSVSCEKKC